MCGEQTAASLSEVMATVMRTLAVVPTWQRHSVSIYTDCGTKTRERGIISEESRCKSLVEVIVLI